MMESLHYLLMKSHTIYFQQWVYCAVGIFLVAFGVSVKVMANLVTIAGEGIILAICKVVPIQ